MNITLYILHAVYFLIMNLSLSGPPSVGSDGTTTTAVGSAGAGGGGGTGGAAVSFTVLGSGRWSSAAGRFICFSGRPERHAGVSLPQKMPNKSAAASRSRTSDALLPLNGYQSLRRAGDRGTHQIMFQSRAQMSLLY